MRVWLLLGLVACTGSKEEVEPEEPEVLFQLEGSVYNIDADAPGGAGGCVELFDPAGLVTGEAATSLGVTTIDGDGDFRFEEVSTSANFGLLWTVRDCAEEGALYATTSGVSAESYADLADGDLLGDQTAFALTQDYADRLGDGAALAGYGGDLTRDGFVFGWVFDADAQPVEGATVRCPECGDVYYQDGDDTDGLLTDGDTANTTTLAAGGAVFIVPAGPLDTYEADNGSDSFSSVFAQSDPGGATTVAMFAE